MKLVPGASLLVVQISYCVRVVTVVFHPSEGLADDSHIKLWGCCISRTSYGTGQQQSCHVMQAHGKSMGRIPYLIL